MVVLFLIWQGEVHGWIRSPKAHFSLQAVAVVHVNGVRLYLWTAATNGPIVHFHIIWVWRVTVEWYWQVKANNSGKTLFQCHSVHHTDWPGRKPGLPQWGPANSSHKRHKPLLHSVTSRHCSLLFLIKDLSKNRTTVVSTAWTPPSIVQVRKDKRRGNVTKTLLSL
jgi:hypothetical protein